MKKKMPEPIKDHAVTKKVRELWNFDAPAYDKRSSNFVNAGLHHGVGYKNPIGHTGPAKQFVPTLPQGRAMTLKDDEIG